MSVQSLTVSLPEPLYQQLKERAEQSNRTVEDETVDLLAAAIPAANGLSSHLQEAVAPLALLDDAALWRAARSRLADEARTGMEELHLKQQREGLTEDEGQTLATLVRQYERAVLVRARAVALLKERGHDVTPLLITP